jgi:hypothetical protein
MPEPRTLQPLQFFKDVGDARGRNTVQDFRPTVTKGDPLGDYATANDEPASVIVTGDESNEPARPPMDADDAPEPDESIEEDEDQGSVDDLLTRNDEEEIIAADGSPDSG